MRTEHESFRGHIDGLEYRGDGDWVLVGWAQDAENPDKLLDIEVVEGTRVLAVGRTGIYREDAKNAGMGDGFCGLSIALAADLLRDRQEYDLALRVAGNGIAITPPTSIRKSTLLGFVDGFRDGTLYGWALNPGDPTTPVAVDILVDGEFYERASADQRRDDVGEQYGRALCGFRWALPPELAEGAPRRIVVRIANTSMILPGKEESTATAAGNGSVRGLSEVPSSLRDERRYRAYIDEYYRAARLAIEAIAADIVIYAGHAAHEFDALLARLFQRAYTGSLNRVVANPTNGVADDIVVLNILHMELPAFTAICLSGAADTFLHERIKARQPTVLLVESPDSAGGLETLDLTLTRQWCAKVTQNAQSHGLDAMLHNTLVDFFFGHPGFILSIAEPA